MSRKSRIDPSLKIRVVEKYLDGKISSTEAAREAGVYVSTVRQWISLYRNEGPAGLIGHETNAVYSNELKLQAVKDYLDGKGSYRTIAEKYKLRNDFQLRNWVKKYNSHEDFSIHKFSGGSRMGKARATTKEERLAIVQYCLENDRNYGLAAKEYNCSYQQVRTWVLKYEEMGEAGLEDRRGKRVGTQPSRTREEELRDRIAQLERKNNQLQMENDILKKVKEIERRGRYH
jgi:transposase